MRKVVSYHYEKVDFTLTDPTKYTTWLQQIAKEEGVLLHHLQYIFCTDDYLLQVNKEHLNHDYYTDIITFPYQQGRIIESDIYISIERVKDNASTLSAPFHSEFLRVMAHGLLHLIGYADKTKEQAETMRAKEQKCISLF